MKVDFNKCRVFDGKNYIYLSTTENSILKLLYDNKDKILTYEEIAKSIYPGIYDDQMKITIRKHISNLKKKIGKYIKIRNVRPTGYIIEEDIL